MHPSVKGIHDIQALRLENAKLRRLARYHAVAVEHCGCFHCPYYEDEDCPTETEPMREGCRLRSELRELGVEVSI